MAERSVSAMRAMFEAKGENQSPPSRGRSPAGSERSNGSRNVSNIRSSFVAVEKSGTHGPMLGLRRISDAEQPADGASPSGRGRNPLSRTSSLTNVQEEEGGLGTILKGSPFEDSRTSVGRAAPRSVPEPQQDNDKPAKKSTAPTQPTLVQKVAGLAQGTVDKFKATAPLRDQPATQQKPAPIATKALPKEKSIPASAKTPTSATRGGPALKVSSPSTVSAPVAKPAPRKPTQPQEPKLSSRASRPSLAAGGVKEPRAKSPPKPAPSNKPRVSDAAALRHKPSRQSLGNADPEVLSRLARPTQASALRTEKDVKSEEKKPRQSMGKAPDSSFFERMMRPTQASANKHHEKDVKPEDSKKSARNSTGGREPAFLERMMRPTAASSSKHHEKGATPAEEPRAVATTPPRSKAQIAAAAVTKPKQKLEAVKQKVEEKLDMKSSSHEGPVTGIVPAGVAPERTEAEVEAARPTVERVETEKADGVPHLTPAASVQASQDEARAKRAAPVLAKGLSRDNVLEAASPGKQTEKPVDDGVKQPSEEKSVLKVEGEQAAAVKVEPESSTTAPVSKEPSEPAAKPVDPNPEPSVETAKPTSEAVGLNAKSSKLPSDTNAAGWTSLKSENTKVAPPVDTSSAGAGDAPAPVAEQGAHIVQKAKEEALEEEKRREGEALPTDSLTEAVANVQ